MTQRCKQIQKDGFHTCGSYAFNLWSEGIDQGDLCDVHYWQQKAQRQWVGLTDEEIDAEADKEEQAHGFIQGVAWADAKLKEKNT
jgi:hypothetical protein